MNDDEMLALDPESGQQTQEVQDAPVEVAPPSEAVPSSSSSSTPQSLSHLAYANWLRSSQRKLIAAADQGKPPSESQLFGLFEALTAKHKALTLTDVEWKIWCAATLWHATSPNAGPNSGSGACISDLDKLREVIELHQTATRSSNGSALHLPSFLTYIHTLLAWHYMFEEADQPVSFFWEEGAESEGEGHWSVESRQDLLREWTGLQNGPQFLQLRHSTTGTTFVVGYDRRSLPAAPTRTQVRAVGMEDAWDAILGEAAIRELIREAISRASGETSWSHLLWNSLRDFEIFHLLRNKSLERIEAVKQVYLARLRSPHRTHEETAQAFSTFVSRFLPADQYEKTMTSAQKAYGNAKALWATVETYEDSLRATIASSADAEDAMSWQAWSTYLKALCSRRNADTDLVGAAFERCIAFLGLLNALLSVEEDSHPPRPDWEASFKNARLKLQREERSALDKTQRENVRQKRQKREGLFVDYIAFLTTAKAPASQVLDVAERAVRCLPGSGILWADYLRQLARFHRSKSLVDETLTRALEGGQCLQEDQEKISDGAADSESSQMIELLVGRIDAEREMAAISLATERNIELTDALTQLPQDEARFMEVFALVSYTLTLPEGSKRAAAAGDHRLRLQRFASAWCEAGGEGMASLAESIWDAVLSQQPTNGRAWSESANYYVRVGNVRKARSLYRQGASRHKLSERSHLLDAWKQMEAVYGSAEDISKVDERVRREAERQWEEWAQYTREQQQYDYAAYGSAETASAVMEVDKGTTEADTSSSHGQKRKGSVQEGPSAMEVETPTAHTAESRDAETKRGRQGDFQPTRDRENSSILVAGLPADARTKDLQNLFADCGPIREISEITATGESAAGVVEFMDRSSIPAARTKDKKRVRGSEVSVSLGWECTLYVTNFPAEYDDAAIRALFSNYGTLHNVRWPSKRFDSSRRFCYVQFTRPREATEAQAALHQHSLAPGTALQVHLSDPSRRKQRTDANANDRELFVTGIPKKCSPEEVQSHFDALGDVQGFRMPRGQDGQIKGIAFVDYRTPIEAQRAAVELNGTLVGGKAIRVQLADSSRSNHAGGLRGASSTAAPSSSTPQTDDARGARARGGENGSSSSQPSTAGFASRSVKVRGLPPNAQEPLIQQLFERVVGGSGKVRKVEWTPAGPVTGKSSSAAPAPASAIVEFEDAATAGRVALMSGQIAYEDAQSGQFTLTVLPLERGVAAGGAAVPASRFSTSSNGDEPSLSSTAFVPRSSLRGRGRGSRGRGRGAAAFVATARPTPSGGGESASTMDVDPSASASASASAAAAAPTTGLPAAERKGQNAFREMLKGGQH
ncbi:unnamed protein product [Parajaminaea phylloscopi]